MIFNHWATWTCNCHEICHYSRRRLPSYLIWFRVLIEIRSPASWKDSKTGGQESDSHCIGSLPLLSNWKSTMTFPALECDGMYTKYTLKGISVEILPDTIYSSMRLYLSSNGCSIIHYVAHYVTWIKTFQGEASHRKTGYSNNREGSRQNWSRCTNQSHTNILNSSPSSAYRSRYSSQRYTSKRTYRIVRTSSLLTTMHTSSLDRSLLQHLVFRVIRIMFWKPIFVHCQRPVSKHISVFVRRRRTFLYDPACTETYSDHYVFLAW